MRKVSIIESHTGGEPTRVVVAGANKVRSALSNSMMMWSVRMRFSCSVGSRSRLG